MYCKKALLPVVYQMAWAESGKGSRRLLGKGGASRSRQRDWRGAVRVENIQSEPDEAASRMTQRLPG